MGTDTVRYRPDREGQHRTQFDKNKRIILRTQELCGICGKPVDKSLRYPHPMSPTVDHIIPVSKGGHPSDIDNLQLAHWCCNRQKSDSLAVAKEQNNETQGSESFRQNRRLPQSMDWTTYRG
jgi:5-methylcytosine-specific restriction endonuclease McrA